MRRGQRNDRNERGSALLATTVIVTMVLSFLLAGMALVTLKSGEAALATERLQAQNVAEAGIEHGIYWLREVMKIWGSVDVFDRLDPDGLDGIDGHATQIIFAQPQNTQLPGALADASNAVVGEYDVFADVRNRGSTDSRAVILRSRGYVPSKQAYLEGNRHAAYYDVNTRIRISQSDGKAGNYAYFINHWGWFYGATITSNGSSRANGKFTLRYNPTINGSPIYNGVEGSNLLEKLNNGGVFAGLDIDGACNGMGALAENRYEYQDPIVMPNLSDLSWYRRQATERGSTLSLGGVELTGNGVYGDQPGEKQHLFLKGTAADPIRISGTVVVEGAVVISGYVTGQGAIVAGDNAYIADDIKYLNPPATRRPAGTSEAVVEAWLADNMAKDFLGLYAREHIVAGNYTNATWQSNVFGWLKDALNRGDEDSGLDGIHNTADESENDGAWSIERYSPQHAVLNLIPEGRAAGDIIPASGEDLDGDGIRDERIATNAAWLAELQVPAPLSLQNWGGNLPVSKPDQTLQYSAVSTNAIGNFDGCYFTNHAFAAYLTDPNVIRFNGALISRNEAIVFSPRIEMNHDERLTGRSWEELGIVGGGGKVWDAIVIEAWWTDSGACNENT